MKRIVLIAIIISAFISCKKNGDCGKSTTTYHGARMETAKDLRVVDSKDQDVFKTGIFTIEDLKLYTLDGEKTETLDFSYSADTTDSYYIISAPVSYTVEGFPLILDFGTGRKDTITFKEIGFNSCSGAIDRIELSSGVKDVQYDGKITLNL